jgi:hypothetical protein
MSFCDEILPGEFRVMKSALNEVLELMDPREFETRLGATEEEVVELIKKLSAILRRYE